MATKKYLSLDGLTEYDALIKAEIAEGDESAKAYTDNSITNLVNSAPETLDTLGELATAFTEHEEVVDVLNEAITNKQNKNIVVTKGSDGLASMSGSEIWAAVQAGISVYYSPYTAGGTLHPFLEGNSTLAGFYSCYIDNSRLLGNYFEIDNNKNITHYTYNFSGIPDIDTTLSVEGDVADAKAVGDAISWGAF